MTKGDFIWVLIRGTGFLLVLRALVSAKDAVSAFVMLNYGGPEGSEFAKMWAQSAHSSIADATMSVVFYAIVGLYLLRGGNWIYHLINYVSRERSKGA